MTLLCYHTIQQTKKLLSCNQYVQYDTLGPNHRNFYCIDVVVETGAGSSTALTQLTCKSVYASPIFWGPTRDAAGLVQSLTRGQLVWKRCPANEQIKQAISVINSVKVPFWGALSRRTSHGVIRSLTRLTCKSVYASKSQPTRPSAQFTPDN